MHHSDPTRPSSTVTTLAKDVVITGLFAGMAYILYQQLIATKRKPFSNHPTDKSVDDLGRYNNLLKAREILGPVPESWELDKGAPKYSSSFRENATAILSRLEDVDASHFPQKEIIIGMIYDIHCLFKSWNKRWNITRKESEIYRNDGFEAMFYTDLVKWLGDTLITRDIKEKGTDTLIKQWIDYCSFVANTVFMKRGAGHIDAKSRLTSIIGSLNRLHTNVIKAQQESTFNDKIQQINTLFIQMTDKSFDLFFLLLNGVHREKNLVKVLLEHDDEINKISDPQYKILTQYQISQWMIATLKAAGIKDNDFKLENSIDMKSIKNFLVTNTAGITDLKATGLPDFAHHKNYTIELVNGSPWWAYENVLYLQVHHDVLHYDVRTPENKRGKGTIRRDVLGLENVPITVEILNSKLFDILTITSAEKHTYKPESNVSSYLDQILQLFRSLLMTFSVRQSMALSTKISTGLGYSWAYNDGACLNRAKNILSVIEHSFNDLHDKLQIFWRCYYTDDFLLYQGRNESNPCYKSTNLANQIVNSFEAYKEQLKNIIAEIHLGAVLPEHKTQFIKECEIKLDDDIDMYCQITGLEKKSISQPSIVDARLSQGMEFEPDGPTEDFIPLPGPVIKQPTDGNCFFHALSYELKRQKSIDESPLSLR